eukprot:5132345-Prymnesium_polylepis.1
MTGRSGRRAAGGWRRAAGSDPRVGGKWAAAIGRAGRRVGGRWCAGGGSRADRGAGGSAALPGGRARWCGHLFGGFDDGVAAHALDDDGHEEGEHPRQLRLLGALRPLGQQHDREFAAPLGAIRKA